MEIKTKDFFTFYASDCRKRHFHRRSKNKILGFVIQLEIFIKGKWYPIVRYDTSHKFAHCDILSWKGKKEKLAIPTLDFNDALFYGDNDLSQNWEIYRENFLKGVKENEK